MTPEAFVEALRRAMALLNDGRAAEARPQLEHLIAARPEQPDPYALLGLTFDQLGDPAQGEALLRRAIALAPAKAQYPFELARLLARAGRPVEAAEAYRAHLALAPGHAAARHNLGAALLDACRAVPAEAALRGALKGGHDAPETWLVLGRALEAQGRHGEAESAYRSALTGRPLDPDVHRDLAQLVWRRTQDVAAASGALDTALQGGAPPELLLQKAKLLEWAGDAPAAFAFLGRQLALRGDDPVLLAATAQAGLSLDPAAALSFAERAAALTPKDPAILLTLCQAQLATGEAASALETARAARRLAPTDQQAIALATTAQRLLGDATGHDEVNYELVRTYRLIPPPPWTDLPSFLADLAAALGARHRLAGHPIGQSTRGGGEAALDAHFAEEPAIRGFFEAVRTPIAQHIAALGQGARPFRIAGAWSVRLRPGGFHANHVHPRGWISSAFYVALPSAVDDAATQAGWLKFGQPGPPTRPALPPEHFVRPEPGLLALFPSYLWHGTVPFGGDEPRLSIAFDVVPA
ncbi:MAG TPA: putative 2OG-Fe(II) oxygenase [Caulobacteraceae bacterium]|nr:putative 2OG-Fe(II) oxygenase [Caulobacteraceae bacterium]